MTAPTPGRDLDAEVAERVMGWRWVTVDEEQPDAVPYLVAPDDSPLRHDPYYPKVAAKFPNVPRSGGGFPAYSSDIAAAWEMVEAMRKRGWRVTIQELKPGCWPGAWIATFYHDTTATAAEHFAATPEMALCLAALAASAEKGGEG